MRILVLNYEFPPVGGGGGVACYQLAMQFIKRGHDVDYLTSLFDGQKRFEIVDRINIYRVPIIGREKIHDAPLISLISFPFTSILKGLSLCNKRNYDVINAHFVVPSGISAILLSKIFRIPLIISIHGGDIYDPSKTLSPHKSFFLRYLIKRLLDNSDLVVAQSSNTFENARKYYKTKKDINIIPLGFKPLEFAKLERKELGFSDNDFIMISIGRIIKRKGYNYSFQALKKLKNKHPEINFKYILLGDGVEMDNLSKLSKELKLEKNIIFAGFVTEDEKFQYLSISNLYLLSSLHEGFGICLQEAMFCSLPIVATDNGGQKDFITDGKNGFMIPVQDVDAIVEAVSKIIENPELGKAFGSRNREEIKKYYVENIADVYLKMYEKAIRRFKC